MPIDPDFPKNHQVIGKHSIDDEHYHYVWGPGRGCRGYRKRRSQRSFLLARGEQQVPLGVHGTMVAIDWDSCVADGACIEACPYKYSNGTGQNKMSLLSKWSMLQASGQEAQLRKREKITLTRLIRYENMTASGVWPVFLFVLHRQ